jgi:hypothetical protein
MEAIPFLIAEIGTQNDFGFLHFFLSAGMVRRNTANPYSYQPKY